MIKVVHPKEAFPCGEPLFDMSGVWDVAKLDSLVYICVSLNGHGI